MLPNATRVSLAVGGIWEPSLRSFHDVTPIKGHFLTEGLEVLRQEITSQVGHSTADP